MSFSLFSTPQQQAQTPFSSQSFLKSGPLFTPQQQQPFQQTSLQPQPQLPQQQQQQIYFLFTNDKAPASYSTKWADLHPDSQKLLHKIEEKILEYRDESFRLDQCSRLYDSSVANEGFEVDADHILQDLAGISSALDRQKAQLHSLMVNAKEMLRNTETAIRSYMMWRPRFGHSNIGGTTNVTAQPQAPGTITSNSAEQSVAHAVPPVLDFYSGFPRKPSPFFQQTVARFESYLSECCQWIGEIEELLADSEKNSVNPGSLVQSLPQVMANVHDFFVHVAAKAENIHQFIESMKKAYLSDQYSRGDGNDPFLEADRRERAKKEAAAKRVHPTLHLHANPQNSTQVTGLLANSSTPGVVSTPQTAGVTASSSGSGFSFASSLSMSSSSMSSLFATPTTSAATSFVSSSGATPQLSLFPSSSTSLIGSTSSPLFGTSGGSLFSTPFASGAATGSGASFGPSTKSQRPKSRTARR